MARSQGRHIRIREKRRANAPFFAIGVSVLWRLGTALQDGPLACVGQANGPLSVSGRFAMRSDGCSALSLYLQENAVYDDSYFQKSAVYSDFYLRKSAEFG